MASLFSKETVINGVQGDEAVRGYIREDDQWYFLRRRISFWFREVDGKKIIPETGTLPGRWPTWATFWENVEKEKTVDPSG